MTDAPIPPALAAIIQDMPQAEPATLAFIDWCKRGCPRAPKVSQAFAYEPVERKAKAAGPRRWRNAAPLGLRLVWVNPAP